MSGDNIQSDSDGADEFGLSAPRQQLDGLEESQQQKHPVDGAGPDNVTDRSKPKPLNTTPGVSGNWRGFEEEVEEEEPEIDFGGGKKLPEDELDMTPMVDVTFLLLIFFMVTASFTMRKSFEQSHSQTDDPSPNVVDPVDDTQDFVEVIIDQTNTFYIRTRDTEEIEAPSDREMRDTLREAKEIAGAQRLIIRAHVDALHSKVVKVLDMGNKVGMQKIETIVTDVEY